MPIGTNSKPGRRITRTGVRELHRIQEWFNTEGGHADLPLENQD